MGEARHGTTRRYNAYKCRCTPCEAAKSRYATNRTRLMAYGQWTSYSDPGLVRAHVESLMGRGLSPTAIADMAGVNVDCVDRLLAGAHVRGPYTVNAEALLSVTFDLDAIPDRVLVDATGTRRRAQALMVLGYSLSAQADRLGRAVTNYYKVTRTPRVMAGTARAVRDLYDELSMTPAPPSAGAALARKHAERNGWLPPLAWDDLIDLPDSELDAEVRRRVALMDRDELVRCHDARFKQRDRSPVVAEAAREYKRRIKRDRESAA